MSWKFNVDDRVKIARQPSNQVVQLVGEIGVINEISADGSLCNITTFGLGLGSSSCGHGTVPTDCLEPFSSPVLEQKIAAREAELQQMLSEGEARTKRWRDLVFELSAKHHIPADVVEEIMDAGRSWN